MKFKRQGGLLLHPTSLPGPYGIGSLGRHALAFIDSLVAAKIRIWQILPLGPTGYADSPYQCFSAFAGNPYLIDLESLQEQDLLHPHDLPPTSFPEHEVDFGKVIPFKLDALHTAYQNFKKQTNGDIHHSFKTFCSKNSDWLDNYAIFRAIKESNGGTSWMMWSPELQRRSPKTLAQVTADLSDEIDFQKFTQYLFFKQWSEVKTYANDRGVKIFGDIPLYVSLDSVEVWIEPENFLFTPDMQPISVAGVPPDYFSSTGQLWGNPIFNWDTMQKDGFEWWIRRVAANLDIFDILRIDHFRGLESYWSVPYGDRTAANGKWVKAPGANLFKALHAHFGDLPIVAENLGQITPEVDALLDAFALPGMKILQFAFDSGEENEYLPHTYGRNCAVYTGTHDNNTVLGWVEKSNESDRRFMFDYLHSSGDEIHWDFIRLAWASVASLAIVPMQDVLGAGTTARMNLPGTTSGNWMWRMKEGEFNSYHIHRLAELSRIYSR